MVKPEGRRRSSFWPRDAADFDYLVDITAVDWPKRAERFELVYILYSFSHNKRLRLKTRIADPYRRKAS